MYPDREEMLSCSHKDEMVIILLTKWSGSVIYMCNISNQLLDGVQGDCDIALLSSGVEK